MEGKFACGLQINLQCKNIVGIPTIHCKTTDVMDKSSEWIEIQPDDNQKVDNGIDLTIGHLEVGNRYLFQIVIEEEDEKFVLFTSDRLLRIVGKSFF